MPVIGQIVGSRGEGVSVVRDVIVVGCGIVGATVAAAFRRRGADVLALDDSRPLGGTAPSGGHLRPSWFGGMSKNEYEPACELLDEVWGIAYQDFTVRPLGVAARVGRVDTDKVLAFPRLERKVTELCALDGLPVVKFAGGEERCRLLVVAAGVWCSELLPGLGVETKPKQGVSFRLRGSVEPVISPWAPYKQVVAHQQSAGEVWAGDGSAILPQNWDSARTAQCLTRCRQHTGLLDAPVIRTIHGLRPYAARSWAGPCLIRKVGARCWVATGAGKLGTVAAGWAARKLLAL